MCAYISCIIILRGNIRLELVAESRNYFHDITRAVFQSSRKIAMKINLE